MQINVPFLVAALAVQYPVMLLLPLLVGWLLQRRYHAGWRVFFLGALTFVLSQVGHIPFNWAIGLIGGGRGVALWPLPAVAVVAGLSAGVFEKGARYLMLRFGLKQARGWGAALQFGAGHGGAESIIFGLLGLLTLVSMVALATANLGAQNLPGNTQSQVQQAAATFWSTPAYMALLGAWERISAITIHISLSVMVMAAVMRHRMGYLLLAIVLHTLVDVWAVWAGATQVNTVVLEAVVFGMALALLAVAFYIRPRLETSGKEEPDDSHTELVEVLS